MPAVAKGGPDQPKPRKKKKPKKIKPRVLKLKGWLKTPEDWENFDAWVKINALPRKLPEPEPIIRTAVKLRRLQKRLKVLAKPASRPPTQCYERVMTRDMRCAKTTKRTAELAFPKIRLPPDCRELGVVSRAALTYKASNNMLLLSQPKIRPMLECTSPYSVSRGALKRKTTDKDDELARPLKRRRLDDDQCKEPEVKCEGDAQLSPWMEFLAIPSYRKLVGQEGERQEMWREKLVDEPEPRGKQAYEEQMRKRAEQKRRDDEKRREEERLCEEERLRKEKEKQLEKDRKAGEKKSSKVRLVCKNEVDKGDTDEENADEEETVDEECAEEGETKGVDNTPKSAITQKEEKEETEEEKAARLKRKMEKNAWRYEISGTCKEFPAPISKAALNAEASTDTQKLAKPKKTPKGFVGCKDPYKISDGAKSAEASPETAALAKPKHQCEPVQRPPPKEKDNFGMPIYPKPAYGKKLPEPPPYPKAECKTKEQKEEEKKQKEEEKKKQIPIDSSIANAPTIDPMFDPHAAKRQAKERERAAQQKAEKEAADEKNAEDAGATAPAPADAEAAATAEPDAGGEEGEEAAT